MERKAAQAAQAGRPPDPAPAPALGGREQRRHDRRARLGRWAAVLVVVGLLAVAFRDGDDGDDEGDAASARQDRSSQDSASSPDTVNPDAVPGGTLRVGIERPRSFDPATASPASASELLAADLLFDGLTAVGSNGQARPAVASSWEPSADLRTWRFELRPGARFANGREIVADDVKYSIERVARQGASSLAAVRLETVTGYDQFASGDTPNLPGLQVVDDRSFDVILDSPQAALPQLLANPAFGIVPREAVEDTAEGAVPFAEAPVTSGPFSFGGGDEQVVRLVRAGADTALLDGIELFLYDDLSTAYDNFVAGDLDWTLVPATRSAAAADRFGTDGFAPFQAELFYGFNLASPTFADPRFRRAIVAAVDRDAVVNAVFAGSAEPLDGVVPAGVPHGDAGPCEAVCGYDPDLARALVAEAYPGGGVPEVRIDYYEGPSEDAVAGILESSLEAVGIPVARRPLPFEEYQSFAVSGDQELFRLGWIGAYPSPDAYLSPLFSTASPDNATGFADPVVQGLLDEAAATADPQDRLDRFARAEQIILGHAPILPIAQFRTRAVVAEDVRDLELTVGGTFAGERVWLDRE